MNKGVNYYDIALNDYRYFKNYEALINPDYNNPLAIQAQQITEKFLKYIVEYYCQDENPNELLRSHKLHSIYIAIHRMYPEFELNRDDLLFLSSFYYDARYPGVDFVQVDQEDALRCIRIVNDVKEKVDAFIASRNN